ncbi:MAG: DUF1549 domain-containing protein, partial [Acidobacteria bacterium]|nr:DUF1549 domain-containing protein [Acidobacteriota bacterium]
MMMVSFGLYLTMSAALSQDFQKDVLPVLVNRCQGCHGAQQQMAGLRFDKDDPSIGRAATKIAERIASDKKGFRMPPVGAPLEAGEVASLRKWVEAGAKWPSGLVAASGKGSSHWAFQKPAKTAQGSIDRFIDARLKAENVAPSPQADRRTLYRRLSLDLTGLIPAASDVDAFVADARPDAYERAVDRMLASSHYGERWARYWLDLAHYADSDGYEKDLPRPHAWRYRHWVIDALNRDMPFDQFTREQLAGDLIPNATVDQRVAPGFLRAVLTNREA